MRAWIALFALAAASLVACNQGPIHAPVVLGGRTYSAASLNHGYRLYQRGCRACHGDLGDGHGVSAQGLWPPPRDLTQGLYKFGRVPAPGLPPDSELGRILRGGLDGTAMLRWQLADDELDDLLGYVKSLSPRWQKEVADAAPVLPPDPFAASMGGAGAAIVSRGEALYHAKALCATCHPAYVTRQRLFEITMAMNGTGVVSPWSAQQYESRVKDTEYCWRWNPKLGSDGERACEEPVHAVPPDFVRDPMRAVRPSVRVADIYLTLAAGISGAGMPPWKGVLTDEELWSMAYYVDSLAALRGTPSADALEATFRAPANVDWKP
ncbi:MAG: cytochrome c [Polyangia bacterium]